MAADPSFSDSQIDLLHRAGATVLVQEDATRADFAEQRVAGVLERKRRGDVAEVNGADVRLGQRQQRVVAGAVLAPQAQFAVNRIVFVDPAIAVGIVGGEVGKAVTALRAEQLAAIVDLAVGVAAVDGEKAAAGADEVDVLAAAVGVEVEGRSAGRSAAPHCRRN